MSLHHLDPIGVLLGLLVVVAYRRLRQRWRAERSRHDSEEAHKASQWKRHCRTELEAAERDA